MRFVCFCLYLLGSYLFYILYYWLLKMSNLCLRVVSNTFCFVGTVQRLTKCWTFGSPYLLYNIFKVQDMPNHVQHIVFREVRESTSLERLEDVRTTFSELLKFDKSEFPKRDTLKLRSLFLVFHNFETLKF